MKVRNGFVSNSSSSSFVVVGVKLTEDDIAILQKMVDDDKDEKKYCGSIYELFYEEVLARSNKVRVLCGTEDGVKEGEHVVATTIAESDEYSFDSLEMSLEEISNIAMSDEAIELMSNLGIDIRGREVKIYIGTRSC